MIYYREGDLLASDMDVIAHGCNCFCNMGAGIAKQIRLQFPEAWTTDLATRSGDFAKMGWFTVASQHGKRIYNLYSQYKYGGDEVRVEYNYLRLSLDGMKKDLQNDGIYDRVSIGLPMIGCGLANGDWDTVSSIIEYVFGDKDIYVYTL